MPANALFWIVNSLPAGFYTGRQSSSPFWRLSQQCMGAIVLWTCDPRTAFWSRSDPYTRTTLKIIVHVCERALLYIYACTHIETHSATSCKYHTINHKKGKGWGEDHSENAQSNGRFGSKFKILVNKTFSEACWTFIKYKLTGVYLNC